MSEFQERRLGISSTATVCHCCREVAPLATAMDYHPQLRLRKLPNVARLQFSPSRVCMVNRPADLHGGQRLRHWVKEQGCMTRQSLCQFDIMDGQKIPLPRH